MSRLATLAVVVFAAVALAAASKPLSDLDLSHDFLEVDPMQNEYAQLSEQGMAFTELGADVTEEADKEEQTEEQNNEEDAPPTPAAAPAPAAPAQPAAVPAKPAAVPAKPAAPAKGGKQIIQPLRKPLAGWTFRERAAPESVNQTDLYAIAYDRLKQKIWSPLNISQSYPINGHVYMIIGGAVESQRYFEPIITALGSYGVPRSNIVKPVLHWKDSTLANSEVIFHALNNTYYAFKEAKVMVIVHSTGIVPLHAALSLRPTTASLIHGVIAINPFWGGSVIAQNINGLPKNVFTATEKLQLTGVNVYSLTYSSRMEFVRQYPIDYNQLRLLVLATHTAKPSVRYTDTGAYVTKWSKEINDGLVALSDQLVPGGRAIILPNIDHSGLVFSHKATPDFDPVLAAQAWIYTFFKTTP